MAMQGQTVRADHSNNRATVEPARIPNAESLHNRLRNNVEMLRTLTQRIEDASARAFGQFLKPASVSKTEPTDGLSSFHGRLTDLADDLSSLESRLADVAAHLENYV